MDGVNLHVDAFGRSRNFVFLIINFLQNCQNLLLSFENFVLLLIVDLYSSYNLGIGARNIFIHNI